MKQELIALILRVAEEQNSTLPRPVEIEKGSEAGLYGSSGPLDSLGLVRFIVEIEVAVEARFDITVVLANEQAMSQRRSPFLSVGSLAAYIEEIIRSAGVQQG